MNNYYISILTMIGAVIISAFSQILLKKSADRKYETKIKEYLNIPVIVSYSLFFTSVLISTLSLKHIPVSFGPVIESSSYFFVGVLSFLLLKEKISKKQWLGIVLIITGSLVYTI